ncbi:MFS transporter [Nakamurella flava]|uniref:MFS transporter n=1 Tax=Nakamurella flava TaxID=2576308 RepID=A0A4U6QDN0_9ACTN|nr:MFS transporter [Nakamurella flava]TKV58274.1 MFS transporter [Nakamurella flava]
MDRRPHPAIAVLVVAFLALVAAAGFRAAPGPLIPALSTDFGWSITSISAAVSVNLLLYGLTAPFAAALMDRFGIQPVATIALGLVALGSAATVFVTASWQLLLTWGLLIGLGTGSMALAFAATVAQRWFIRNRGLAMGILTAGGAAGQLVFLPIIAAVATGQGWRNASLIIAAVALAIVPLLWLVLRDYPEQRGVAPFGAPEDWTPPPRKAGRPAARSLNALRTAARVPAFWALAAAFAICGATTNGLIGIHFIPSAHDHGMAETTAAGLLAVVGIFDIAGTIGSGWLTDRIDPRLLLVGYYTFRGVGLAVLPFLLADSVHPSMIVFVVVYGLDWVATVPPTVALCQRIFGADGTVVFGWVFASHQIGAAVAALAAGAIRDSVGTYTPAWLGGAGLCLVAAVLSIAVRRRRSGSGLGDDVRPLPSGPTGTAATPTREPAATPGPAATVAGAASDLTP